jgi:pimeloyl-ACP methyl ester carboxylesterase
MSIASSSPAVVVPGHYWQWRNQSIFYVKAGKKQRDRPPLLMVHGFGASTDHWRKNLAGLQENFEVWAIDLLGFGRSAKPDSVYSGDLWRDQLHDFIAEVIGQPALVVGNSLGGYACLCVAADYGEVVAGAILINSAGPFSRNFPEKQPNSFQKVIRSLLLSPIISYGIFQFVRRRSAIRKTLEKVYLDRSAVTEQLVEDIYRPSCDRGAVKVFASVFKSPKGETVDALLQKCNCPLLTIWGEGDPWMKTRERGENFRKYYVNLQEHYLSAGHCPHDEVPDQVNALITDWVNTL